MAETAAAFATALDRADYRTAAALLAEDVEYATDRRTLRGPPEVIGSYREHDEWTRRNLQSVDYESATRVDGDLVVVTFIDRLAHCGLTHTYACEQLLWIDQRGLIRRIEHREIPGQREAVEAFLARLGIKRSQTGSDGLNGGVQ